MSVLYIDPGKSNLYYARVNRKSRKSVSGVIKDYRGASDGSYSAGCVRKALDNSLWPGGTDISLSAVAIRVPAGMENHGVLHVADEALYAELEEQSCMAPLHIPVAVNLGRSCAAIFPGVPVVFVFDAAFFNDLPQREKIYAIDPAIARNYSLVRHGYHGVLHAAACRWVNCDRRRRGIKSGPKIVSICLEPRPEAAAVYGQKPVMVTSGATPLEGLVGDTSCGDIDAGILTAIAKKFSWGPERINRLLTEESGFSGMAAKRVALDDLFNGSSPEMEIVREMFLYRLLLVCGSGIAAMGAIDNIVFSGRYRSAGEQIGPWLLQRLSFLKRTMPGRDLVWTVFNESVEVAVADMVWRHFRT